MRRVKNQLKTAKFDNCTEKPDEKLKKDYFRKSNLKQSQEQMYVKRVYSDIYTCVHIENIFKTTQ